jgi:hypothetical protein
MIDYAHAPLEVAIIVALAEGGRDVELIPTRAEKSSFLYLFLFQSHIHICASVRDKTLPYAPSPAQSSNFNA